MIYLSFQQSISTIPKNQRKIELCANDENRLKNKIKIRLLY